MWRTSATAWAMPSPVLSRSRCAVRSPTRRRADSTCSRIPARVAPRPSCSSRRRRRRSTSRVVTRDSRLRWSCWWSWRAASAGAAWSATRSQDLGIALVEPAFTRPRSHPQPAHDLAAVAEVEGRGVHRARRSRRSPPPGARPGRPARPRRPRAAARRRLGDRRPAARSRRPGRRQRGPVPAARARHTGSRGPRSRAGRRRRTAAWPGVGARTPVAPAASAALAVESVPRMPRSTARTLT